MSPVCPLPLSGWKPVTNVLLVVARRFAKTQAGRTGCAKLDMLIDAEELLVEADAAEGRLRPIAITELEVAERAGLLAIERNLRDPELLHRVRVFPHRMDELYRLLGLPTPAERRERLAALFEGVARVAIRSEYAEAWREFCGELAARARSGASVLPFDRSDFDETRTLLALLPRLLEWKSESYLRFASCVLCGNSKSLENWASRIGTALGRITNGAISSLTDVGIVENPRSVMLHGPLQLELNDGWIDLGLLCGVARIAAADLNAARQLESPARRCISVENETMLHELAKLRGSDLMIGTSFLGSGTRRLLQRLPRTMEFWHFGDSDPAGFAVLADLRERAGRAVKALHMRWRPAATRVPLSKSDRDTAERLLDSEWLKPSEKSVLQHQLDADDKGAFEQEVLGPPMLPSFPFYDLPLRSA